MTAMAEKYSQSFPTHHPSVAIPKGDVVLVTGTTGSLGSTMLAELVAAEDVSHVFAINRKNIAGASLATRQMAAMERQGLDPKVASSSKVTLLEADLSKTHLGLPADVYESVSQIVCPTSYPSNSNNLSQMRSSITHIIHTCNILSQSCCISALTVIFSMEGRLQIGAAVI